MSEDYNLDTQRLLIEALISDSVLFAKCQNIIKPEYFHKQYEKVIKFVHGFADEYKSLPSIEQVYAKTGQELQIISDITPQHQQFFSDEIEKFCRHKALSLAIIEGAGLIEKGQYTSVEKLVKDAILVGLHKDLGTDYYEDPRARLMKLKNDNGNISTGWASVDKKLYNVGRGELMIFAAPSGGGKSVALQNLAVNMSLQGSNCVYITLELSEELCAKRMDSMVSNVKTTDIYKNLDDVELKVKIAGKTAGQITIKKMPSGVCARDIAAYLKEWQIQNNTSPTVLLVDYLDLMMPNDKRISPGDLFVKDKFVSEELRALGHEFDLLVATASQFNRSAVDVLEFDHGHIAGGLSKIQTADNVIGILSSARSRERGEIEFQFLKTRNSSGVGSKTVLKYDINTLRITDNDENWAENQNSNTTQSTSIMNSIRAKKPTPAQAEAKETMSVEDKKAQTDKLRGLINKTKNPT